MWCARPTIEVVRLIQCMVRAFRQRPELSPRHLSIGIAKNLKKVDATIRSSDFARIEYSFFR